MERLNTSRYTGRIKVEVFCPNGLFEIYVNGAVVEIISGIRALKKYLRWIYEYNIDNPMDLELHGFYQEFVEETKEYVFGERNAK